MNNKTPKLQSISAKELLEMDLPELEFTIEEILPQGLFINAGAPKIGKSWLMLDLCITVASGGDIWGFSAEQKDVLYLALEDNYQRLKRRLNKYTNAELKNFHLVTKSEDLQGGVVEQIMDFIENNKEIGLIVIDTMQHIRGNANDKNIYVSDYKDMNLIREITNNYNVTTMLVTHTRKMADSDPLNTISGSTGLIGAVDGVFLLEKNIRVSNQGTLTITNRDTEEFIFNLEFDRVFCKWNLVNQEKSENQEDEFILLISDFINQEKEWKGTATELLKALKILDENLDYNVATLSKKLNKESDFLKNKYNILCQRKMENNSKIIVLNSVS